MPSSTSISKLTDMKFKQTITIGINPQDTNPLPSDLTSCL